MSKYGNPPPYRLAVDVTRRNASSTGAATESVGLSAVYDSAEVKDNRPNSSRTQSTGSVRQGSVRQGSRSQRRLPRMSRVPTEGTPSDVLTREPAVRNFRSTSHEVHQGANRPPLSASTFSLLSAFDGYPDAPPKDIRLNACLERLFERYKRLERDGSWETNRTTGELRRRKREKNKREISLPSYNRLRDRGGRNVNNVLIRQDYDSKKNEIKPEIAYNSSGFDDQNRKLNSYNKYEDTVKANAQGPRLTRTGSRKKRSDRLPTNVIENQSVGLADSVRRLRIRSDRFLRDYESSKLNSFASDQFTQDFYKDSGLNADKEAVVVLEPEDLKYRPQQHVFVPPRATYTRRTRSLAPRRETDGVRFASQQSTAASRSHKTNKTFAPSSSSSNRQRSSLRSAQNNSRQKSLRRTSPEYSRSIRSYPESSQRNVTRTFDQLQQIRLTQQLQRRLQPLSQEILNQAICQLYGVNANQFSDGIYAHTESDDESKNESDCGSRTSRYESPRKRDSLIARMTPEADQSSKAGEYQSLLQPKQQMHQEPKKGIIDVSSETKYAGNKTNMKSWDVRMRSLIPRPKTVLCTEGVRSKSAGIRSSQPDTIQTMGKHLTEHRQMLLSSNAPYSHDSRPGPPSKIPVAIRRLAKSCPASALQKMNTSSGGRDAKLSSSRSRLTDNDLGTVFSGSRSRVSNHDTELMSSRLKLRNYDSGLPSSKSRIIETDLKMNTRSRSMSKHHNVARGAGPSDSERLVRKRIGISDGELNLRHHLWGTRGQLIPVISNANEKWNICDSHHKDGKESAIHPALVESVVRPAGLERIIRNLVSQYTQPRQIMTSQE